MKGVGILAGVPLKQKIKRIWEYKKKRVSEKLILSWRSYSVKKQEIILDLGNYFINAFFISFFIISFRYGWYDNFVILIINVGILIYYFEHYYKWVRLGWKS